MFFLVASNSSAGQRTGYTNTTGKVFITTAAVTPDKRNDAIASARQFLHVDASLAFRRSELSSPHLPGAYFSPRSGHLQPLYAFTLTDVTSAGGSPAQRFVAQGINDGSQIMGVSAPLDMVANAVFLVEDTGAPIPALWAPNLGTKFTKSDLSSVPDVQRLIPDESLSYRIAVAPITMPIIFGQEESCRGPIDDNTASILDAQLPGSSWWASWMANWDQEFQEAVLGTFAANGRSRLSTKFPKVKAQSKPFASSVFVSTTTLFADDSVAQPALDALRRRLFAVLPDTSPPARPPLGEVNASSPAPAAPSVRFEENDDLPPEQGVARIPRRSTAGTYSEAESSSTRFQLSMIAYDENSGRVGIPDLSDDAEWMFFGIAPGRGRNNQLDEMLRSHAELCDAETDFLRRQFDPPYLDQGSRAIFVNALYSSRPMVDIAIKDRYRPHILAPDNASTMRAREAAKDGRDLEVFCGEDSKNLTKVDISILTNTSIFDHAAFMGLLANRVGFIEACAKVNKQVWDDIGNPLIYKFCRTMALAITCHAARQWYKVAPATLIRKFYGWLLQMWDRYECYLGTIPTASRNVLHALQGNFSKIPLDNLRFAEALKEEIMSDIAKIVSGTYQVPTSAIITALDNAEAKKRLANVALKPEKPSKEPKTDKHSSATKEVDNKGCIVYKRRGFMPAPAGEDPKEKICPAFVRSGSICRRGDRCDGIHNLAPETWPVRSLKLWVAHMDATPEMGWASSVRQDLVKAALGTTAPATDGA